MTQKPERRYWTLLLRLAIGLALLALVVRAVDLRAALDLFLDLRPGIALVPFLLFAADRALMAFKWNVLLRAHAIRISFSAALRLYLVGGLVGLVTPGGYGTDVYRVVALGRVEGATVVAATAVLERVIGMAVIGIAALLVLPGAARPLAALGVNIALVVAVVGVLTAIALAVALRPALLPRLLGALPGVGTTRFGARLRELIALYAQGTVGKGALWSFTTLTTLEVLLIVVIDFSAARALGIGVSFWDALTMVPVIQMLVRIPLSIDGLGIQEGMYLLWIVAAGFSPEQGAAFAALRRMLPLLVSHLPAALLLLAQPASAPAPPARGG